MEKNPEQVRKDLENLLGVSLTDEGIANAIEDISYEDTGTLIEFIKFSDPVQDKRLRIHVAKRYLGIFLEAFGPNLPHETSMNMGAVFWPKTKEVAKLFGEVGKLQITQGERMILLQLALGLAVADITGQEEKHE